MLMTVGLDNTNDLLTLKEIGGSLIAKRVCTMTMKREKVFSAITKAIELPDDFLKVVERHVSVNFLLRACSYTTKCIFYSLQKDSGDSFDISEFFQSLTKKQHSVVWESLLSLTQQSICAKQEAEDDEASRDQSPDPKVCVFSIFRDQYQW